MFTGIISCTSSVLKSEMTKEGLRLTFKRPPTWTDLVLGESIATNGICLTIEALRDSDYDCLLMPETLDKSSFGKAIPNIVNLERSISANGRFSGHFVQGHIDSTGTVSSIDASDGWRLSINIGAERNDYVIEKGSITIDGVSLTVAALHNDVVTVALIPYTRDNTTLGGLKVGDIVNLEFDMIGKYAINLMKKRRQQI